MSFYLWAMRSASVILFVMALLGLAATATGHVLVFMQADVPDYGQPDLKFMQMVLSLAVAIENAALPLLGAALLWCADRWLSAKGAAA